MKRSDKKKYLKTVLIVSGAEVYVMFESQSEFTSFKGECERESKAHTPVLQQNGYWISIKPASVDVWVDVDF